jgi:hypothetical protein
MRGVTTAPRRSFDRWTTARRGRRSSMTAHNETSRATSVARRRISSSVVTTACSTPHSRIRRRALREFRRRNALDTRCRPSETPVAIPRLAVGVRSDVVDLPSVARADVRDSQQPNLACPAATTRGTIQRPLHLHEQDDDQAESASREGRWDCDYTYVDFTNDGTTLVLSRRRAEHATAGCPAPCRSDRPWDPNWSSSNGDFVVLKSLGGVANLWLFVIRRRVTSPRRRARPKQRRRPSHRLRCSIEASCSRWARSPRYSRARNSRTWTSRSVRSGPGKP